MSPLLFSEKGKENGLLFFAIICSGVMVFDSIIIRIYANIPREPTIFANLILFCALFGFLVAASYFLLRYLKKSYILEDRAIGFSRLTYRLMVFIQLGLCSLIGLIAAQLISTGSYYILLLSIVLYSSYLCSAGFLVFIIYHFFRWFQTRKYVGSILYGIAFSLLIVNMVVSMLYFAIILPYYDSIIEIRPVKVTIGIQSITPSNTMFPTIVTIYDYASITSFLVLWAASVYQLRTYIHRLGFTKYWILVSFPIIFYMIPLLADESHILDSARLYYGSQFNLLYTIVFGPYRQIGGLLIGVVFWVTSMKISRKNLRVMLQMAGTGIVLLLGSTVLHGLSFIASPPFGLVTVAFMTLSAYMLSTGIYSSSRELAKDAILRKELSRIRHEQHGLLSNASLAEVEKELVTRLQPALAKLRKEDESFHAVDISNEKTDEFIRDILKDIESARKKNPDNHEK